MNGGDESLRPVQYHCVVQAVEAKATDRTIVRSVV